jgi:hypothetical protein
VEVRARSRVTALIEYGAQGQFVAVCPRQGVLSLVPDSPQWFDWLAQLASFRGCRDQQGAFRRVGPPKKIFFDTDGDLTQLSCYWTPLTSLSGVATSDQT